MLGSDDPGYDAARSLYDGLVDRKPALIIRCATTNASSPHEPSEDGRGG